MSEERLFQEIRRLVEAWCDRRALVALRCILNGYPLVNRLTDGWADLMIALQNVGAFACGELTEEELAMVNECVRVTERVVYRR